MPTLYIKDSFTEDDDAVIIINRAKQLQYDICVINDINDINKEKDFVLIDEPQFTHIYFDKIPDTYEPSYNKLYKRSIIKDIWLNLKHKIANNELRFPLFIKSIGNDKKLDGIVLHKTEQLIYINEIEDGDYIYASEYIKIHGEYRMFLYEEYNELKYKLVNYSGISDYCFKEEFLSEILNITRSNQYKYLVIDIGFNNESEFIVEINPPYWVDSYGINHDFYANFSISAYKYLKK